ncbi:MAG: ABC transporter permease [Dehalococcoidales bacterium]|nr:ABC transporter permease [Dehalococcoidales bacterium]
MKKALYIALKEVRDFLRDKGDLSFSLILPIAIFALIVGAFGGSFQFNGTAYIVNQDHAGRYSKLLIEKLGKYEGLTVEELTPQDAESRLLHSDILLAVYIPPDFSQNLEAVQPVQIVFKQRGNGGTEGQIVANLVKGAAEGIGQDLLVKDSVKNSLANSMAGEHEIELIVEKFIEREEAHPVVSVTETDIGSSPDPVNQFLPGIMTMFVLFAINMTAQALVEERRKGTLERLLTTRLKIGELFTGKFLAYTARGFIQTLILLLLAAIVFRIFTPVSFLTSLLIALVFAAAASTIGLIIGSIARSEGQATWVAVFFTMLMVMLSGTFVPVTEGTVFYNLSRFSLNTWANEAFTEIIARGGSLGDIGTPLLVLLGVAVIGLIISRLLFRASQGKR